MKLVWDAMLTYKAFYSDETGIISLLSSRISKMAHGHQIGDNFYIVSNQQDEFCDFEIFLEENCLIDETPPPSVFEVAKLKTCVFILEICKVVCKLGNKNSFLQISFNEITPVSWVKLNENNLFLGVDENNFLGQIYCADIAFDPTGKLEEEWLTQCEKSAFI